MTGYHGGVPGGRPIHNGRIYRRRSPMMRMAGWAALRTAQAVIGVAAVVIIAVVAVVASGAVLVATLL